MLRIDLLASKWSNAFYDDFKVGDEDNFYAASYNTFLSDQSSAPDSFLNTASGVSFSTNDSDHDTASRRNCARAHQGAWWYGNCYLSNLNGARINNDIGSVSWNGLPTAGAALKRTRLVLSNSGRMCVSSFFVSRTLCMYVCI